MDRILIIEDDPDLCDSLKAVLSDNGFQVDVTGSRKDATQALSESEPFAALVVDVNLPDGHGIDLIRDLRDQAPDVRIVAITGGGAIDPSVGLPLARAHGADAVLLKPFNPQELVTAVRGEAAA